MLIIHRTDLASYGWEVVRNSQAVEKSYLEGDPAATLRAAAWIQHDVAQQLFTLAGLGDLDQAIDARGQAGLPRALNFRSGFKAHVESRVRRYVSANVVGRVRRRSSEPDNAVLYTAHYDHLGIDPDAKGDNIYNGAADNGTGCGILLETGARLCAVHTAPAARGLLCRGHRRRAGPARLAISRHASAGSGAPHRARSELRHAAAHRHSALGEPWRRRAHRLLAHGRRPWPRTSTSQLLPDPTPMRRPLLPLRSLLAGARRHSRLLRRSGRAF